MCLERTWRRQFSRGHDQAFDFVDRVDVRNAASFPIAKMVMRWQFVPRLFQANVLGKPIDGLVPSVPLSSRRAMAGPLDRSRSANKPLLPLSGKTSVAAEQVLGVAERKTGSMPQSQIGFDSFNHGFTSGHGWAICRSWATSTFA